jgi:dethiobiotin synthetase
LTARDACRLPPGFFVTGTDTGVGKTLAACALLHALAARGLRAAGMKPVAAGARRRGAELRNEDVTLLSEAGNVEAPLRLRNPYCFAQPIAPHIAARLAGVDIEIPAILRAWRSLARLADVVVVEGAGGFCVPLNEREDMADLASRLRLPVILVVGMRLGCLNHALLTAHAIGRRRLRLAGWIANHIDPRMARADDNVAALARRLAAPCIARIPYSRAADARRLARMIDVDALCR